MKHEELLRKANNSISRINGLYRKWYQDHYQNSYLMQTLYALYMDPGLSQKEISVNYMIPSQTVNNVIKSLEKDGYIKLRPDKKDKRAKKIIFTAEGKKYVGKVLAPLLILEESVVDKMSVEKFKKMVKLMEHHAQVLEGYVLAEC